MVRITVIIPTKNRMADLNRCLAGLNDNNLKLLAEVIVIDDGSSKPLKVKDFDFRIKLIRNNVSMGAGKCRNIAGVMAEGDIIAFLDDDAIPHPDWLDIINNEMSNESKKIGGITGKVLGYDKGIISQARQARYDKRYLNLKKGEVVNFFSGGNSAVYGKLFKQINGFTNNGSGGDNHLSQDLKKIGYNIIFVPELIILHRNSKGIKRAVIEAFKSGRQYSQKKILLKTLKESINFKDLTGDSLKIKAINWALNVVHLWGRVKL